MRWPCTLRAEIFNRLDNTSAKELRPESVDNDPSGERVVTARQPLRQAEAVARCVRGELWQHSRHTKVDFGAAEMVSAAFKEEGVAVLYGDTDSVFVQLSAGGDAARTDAEALRERVERRIAERVRADYRVEPRLELELEGIYERFFMPRVRGGRSGSKKRYAGQREGSLEVVGLESVRRDWPAVAGRLQRGALERVFRDEDAMPFVREIVAQLKAGELDEELVYVKRVRKASVDAYTATTPPHVQVARKAGDRAGPIIRYVMTAGGPEPVFPGCPLPDGIDHGHYVEKVLRPIADAILEVRGQSFDEALDRPRQLALL